MKRMSSFSRCVNGDYDLVELPSKEDLRIPKIWSTRDLELMGASVSFIEKQKTFISKEEMAWLREGMLYRDSSLETTDNKGLSPLQECFQRYYSVFEEIGNIWAVQLREHGIDIVKLEEETGCVLNKNGFYVERSLGGLLGEFITLTPHVVTPETMPSSSSAEVPPLQTPSVEKQPRKRGRRKKVFEDFVHKDAPKNLMTVLEEMMNGASGREVLTIILSITGVYIDRPTVVSICEKFNTVKQNAIGEAKARHEGGRWGKKDFSKNANPIPETELKRMLKTIAKKITEKPESAPEQD